MYVCGGRDGKYCAFLGNSVAFMWEWYLNLKKAKNKILCYAVC